MNPRVLALLAASIACLAPVRAAAPVDYLRDVRPILADLCFNCHGPDAGSRKGKLRLDTREDALKGGKSGEPTLVPGKPDASEFIKRLVTGDVTELMPPPKSGKKLTVAQIDTLRRWVAEGAKYGTHWGFTTPRRPATPVVKDITWVRTAIDALILARLEKEGLTPAPRATRETLIRRLSLDLTGLPPTLEQVDAFVADRRPDAYERLVNRLLASPAYGEKWGRHWLDAARYADSDGYEKDKPRAVWMFRDWVVSAFNRDLPYDRFVLEQLAGDLLPDAGQDQRVATGFLRNSMINEEGGIDPEQFRMEAMFDRMDAIGKSVLGLALNCCQCHDHKYDPLSQTDYYRIFAFLNDTHEANIAAYTMAEQQQRAEIFRTVRAVEDDLKHRTPDWMKRMAVWEERVRREEVPWTVVKVENAGDNSQRYLYHDDGSQTAWGYAPTKWSAPFTGKTDVKRITGFRLELLTDPNLPLGGPGRSPTGAERRWSEFSVEVAGRDEAEPEASCQAGVRHRRLRQRRAAARTDVRRPRR
ncbi:MAG: DUF1549 domain-containing protein [Gemmataceae bacterium]